MLFIYVEKGKIPIKPIEYIKKYRLKIVIKELDIITKEILEMYEIKNFPCLVNWSVQKEQLAKGEKEIMRYLVDDNEYL